MTIRTFFKDVKVKCVKTISTVFVAKLYFLISGLAPLPLPLARAVVPPTGAVGEDDGSWGPNKYDPIEVPVAAPLAAPWASPLATPLAASWASPLAAPLAAPWASPLAAPWAAPIGLRAALPIAPIAPLALQDDGSYWAGKYGPENIQDISALAS